MTSFSERQGYKPLRRVVQKDGMDEDLRNGLWNALTLVIWDRMRTGYVGELDHPTQPAFVQLIWFNHLKLAVDTIPFVWADALRKLRDRFFGFEWFEVYDFLEFVAANYPHHSTCTGFMNLCNEVLERELSAYRFIGGVIAPIVDDVEIREIEDSLSVARTLGPVEEHLTTALRLLSDRDQPDYRNSIKEAISAVEAICKLSTGSDKATLADALKELAAKGLLHPALKSAFNSLYGYTSDAQGIRHALLDEETLDFNDAKFMLVTCCAFVNYLRGKLAR